MCIKNRKLCLIGKKVHEFKRTVAKSKLLHGPTNATLVSKKVISNSFVFFDNKVRRTPSEIYVSSSCVPWVYMRIDAYIRLSPQIRISSLPLPYQECRGNFFANTLGKKPGNFAPSSWELFFNEKHYLLSGTWSVFGPKENFWGRHQFNSPPHCLLTYFSH